MTPPAVARQSAEQLGGPRSVLDLALRLGERSSTSTERAVRR